MFLDIGERNIIHCQNLKLSSLLGRGAFGFVYKASIILKGNPNAEVAVKMLQPVDPGPDARKSAQQLYNVMSTDYFELSVLPLAGRWCYRVRCYESVKYSGIIL